MGFKLNSRTFSSIFSIPLPSSPNFSFSSIINNDSFDFEFRSIGSGVHLYIKYENKIIVNGARIVFNFPMNVNTFHIYNKGHFFFLGSGKASYENILKSEFVLGTFI